MSSQNGDAPLGTSSAPRMGLAEVLQICCLGRRNGQITFRAWDNEGYAYVQHGQVLHAISGGVEGEEAIYQMLTWTSGAYTFEDDVLPQKRTVHLTWEQLLFEGARRADEGYSPPPPHPSGMPNVGPVPISTRLQGSKPKLSITIPGEAPFAHDLVNEFTHVGRIEGNEIVIPIPSVSSRHCIFIFSGPDIVLRDLNSANSTVVNGESIQEKILQLGDVIQVGEAEIRFESGIKRPQLRIGKNPSETPEEPPKSAALSSTGGLTKATSALSRPKLTAPKQEETPKPGNNDKFLAGGAIRIGALQHQEKPKTPFTMYLLLGVALVLVLVLMGLGYYVHIHGLRR